MRRKVLFLLVSLLCLSLLSEAQTFVMRGLSTQRQLPMASVHCVMQDKEGYLWYATEGGGLCRDDGYRIDVFKPSTPYLQEACKVHCLTEDHRGRIYFGTSDGLFFVDKQNGYAIQRVEWERPAADGQPSPNSLHRFVETLFTDGQGRVWWGSKGEIVSLDTLDNMVSYTCQIDGAAASVAQIYESRDGSFYALLWPAGKDNLHPEILRMRKGEKAFSPLQWPLTSSTPVQMVEDAQHQCFWVLTTESGVVKMKVDVNGCHIQQQPVATVGDGQRRGLNLLRDRRHGLLWCTTADDLYAYSVGADGQLHPFPLSSFLPEGKKILDQLYESHDGTIYVSGYTPHTFLISSEQSGVRRITAPAISRLTGYPLLADRSVADGTFLWIWQGRTGLLLYDTANDKVVSAPRKFDRTIRRSSQGGIWASDGQQVYRLWQEGGQPKSEAVLTAKEPVRFLHEDHQQHLWIATSHALLRWSLVGYQLQQIATLPAAPLAIETDKQGNVYLALGAEGLYMVTSRGELSRINKGDKCFLSVTVAPDGTLWASTFEGDVYHYIRSTGELKRDDFISNHEDMAVRCILVDGMGHVWTMTDQQVREYVPQSKAFRTIQADDPFVAASYFYALEAVSPNCVAIDGAGGIVEVSSSGELQQQAVDVRPLVSSIVVGGETRLLSSDLTHLELEADQPDLTLHLTTLCHQYADAIDFAYQVDGVTSDWVYLPQGSNVIMLTNLSKGSHCLRVKATDKYGCWGAPVELLTIERVPHWWETWWAYLLYICVLAVVIIAVWRLERRIHLLRQLIHRRQEVRLDEIEMKRDDIADQRWNDEFIRRAVVKTEEHLSDSNYNVEALADDLCMSRITLYRRLQEQTGQAPTEFIRDIRLKKAAQLLLQHPDATITDIARKVGFATPKYFSKCFKAKFGVLPKDYHPQEVVE